MCHKQNTYQKWLYFTGALKNSAFYNLGGILGGGGGIYPCPNGGGGGIGQLG